MSNQISESDARALDGIMGDSRKIIVERIEGPDGSMTQFMSYDFDKWLESEQEPERKILVKIRELADLLKRSVES